MNLSSIELLLWLALLFPTTAALPLWALLKCDEPLIRWPLAGPLDCAPDVCCWRTGTPALLTGRCEMDDAEAVDDGLDLSLFAVRSLVTTADLGCGMNDPV